MRNEVRWLIDSIEREDGAPALSEYKGMRLDGRLDSREIVALDSSGDLVGYGQAAWHRGEPGHPGHWALEVALAVDIREEAITVNLIRQLRADVGEGEIVLWSRFPYVRAAAVGDGWTVQRILLEMRRDLPIEGLDATVPGFEIATFQMGADESDWLQANNAAFAGHPENGNMTRRDLEQRMALPWFDPGGFFLAWRGAQVAGSCWTKLHENGLGEIYIIGVVPGFEGRGLGRALLARGLDHLHRARHVTTAMLYVESDNHRATELYSRLGFVVTNSVEAYRPAS